MAKIAHIKNGKLFKRLVMTDAEVARIPAHKRVYHLDIVQDPRPPFDPATHHGPQPIVTIEADRFVDGWAAPVAKTAEEIDAGKGIQVPPQSTLEFKRSLDIENRIRAQEAPPRPALTSDEYTAFQKAML